MANRYKIKPAGHYSYDVEGLPKTLKVSWESRGDIELRIEHEYADHPLVGFVSLNPKRALELAEYLIRFTRERT